MPSTPAVTFTSGTSTNAVPVLPAEKRHWPISYQSPDGTTGEIAYPINWTELYNLKGRLLTLIDATFTDPQQRKAQKDIVWIAMRDWFEHEVERVRNPDFAEPQDGDASSLNLP